MRIFKKKEVEAKKLPSGRDAIFSRDVKGEVTIQRAVKAKPKIPGEPAIIFEEMLEDPQAKIGDLALGDSGWISKNSIQIDSQGGTWINPKLRFEQLQNRVYIAQATLTQEGFVLGLPENFKLTKSELTGKYYKSKYIPVFEIKRLPPLDGLR